ncbi:MAG: hypothetical protein IT168_25360 [Bryobacterales bacterium]|nr:hypothetical protein [Bryobacterales bacterium]
MSSHRDIDTSAPVVPSDRWAAVFACILAAFCLGQAIEVNRGLFAFEGLAWLALAMLAVIGPMTLGAAAHRDRRAQRLCVPALTAAFVLQAVQLIFGTPLDVAVIPGALRAIIALSALAALLAVLYGLWKQPRGHSWFYFVLAAHLAAGTAVLVLLPAKAIDVHNAQADSLQALTSGLNPYAIHLKNMYGADALKFYDPATVDGDQMTTGFNYPPLSLLLCLPAYLLVHDFRFAHLLAIEITAALIALARPSTLSKLAACVFLFTPRVFFVLHSTWTEPFWAALFTLFVFALVRSNRPSPVLFGLLLAVKQVTVLSPFALWGLFRPKKRFVPFCLQSILIAAAVSAPLVLWDPSAFYRSAVAFYLRSPIRLDSLSFHALFAAFGVHIPSLIPLLASIALAIFAGRRLPATPSGISCALAISYTIFYAFGKAAFCNYYYLVIAFCCAAVAVADLPCSPPNRRPIPASVSHA